MSYSLLFQGNSGYVNAPQCSVYMSIAYLVPSVFAVLGSYENFLRVNVVFIFERFFGWCYWLCLFRSASKIVKADNHNVATKGCVRFLFRPYFLLQFSVSSVALSAVISTFLLSITRLPQHSPTYLQQ
jgi:hypothetical protein